MEKNLRKIAKSYKYQMLYSRAQDMGNIRLFKNDFDFSFIQLRFLSWLQIYHSLFSDLHTGEKHISVEVIDDPLRCDAYLLYRAKKKDSDEDNNNKQIDTTGNIPTIIFRKRKTKKNENL